MNKTWLDGLNEIAAGMLFNGGYAGARVQPSRNEAALDAGPAEKTSSPTTVTPLVRALRPAAG